MKLLFSMHLFLTTVAILCCSVAFAQSYPPPAGWVESKDSSKNAITYVKQGDVSGSVVKIYPAVHLPGRQSADKWLQGKLNTSTAPKGTWLDNMSVTRANANIAYGHRSFRLQDGRQGRLDAIAITIDKVFIRLGASIYIPTGTNQSLVKESVAILSKQLTLYARDGQRKRNLGSKIESSPQEVPGFRKGGVDVKPGLYVGNSLNRRKEVRGKREIILYENGEYEFLHKKKVNGRYVYSKANGRFDMRGEFRNQEITGGISLYGVDEQTNRYSIYAIYRTKWTKGSEARLYWVSPPDRLPPSTRDEHRRLKPQSKRRYEHTTEPGQGIKDSEIEVVLYAWQLKLQALGTTSFEVDPYVLMKDGRVIDDIPVAPFVLDVAKSRSREPDKWGWWKRKDESYVFAWSNDKTTFRSPTGQQVVAGPIPADTRLEGIWKKTSSITSSSTAVISNKTVYFTKDGRFKIRNSTMLSTDGEALGGDGFTGTFSNDAGSSSVAMVGQLTSRSRTESKKPKDGLQGSYKFDGYNLSLEFDNGRITQALTFASGDNYKNLWFNGSMLNRVE